MLTAVEGFYKKGQIKLQEKPQDVTEARVIVTFLPGNGQETLEAPAEPAEASKPVWEVLINMTKDIPQEELDRIPHDMSLNVDHYVYGIPRET